VRALRRGCPCASNLCYEDCCGPIHLDAIVPGTAEQLMRARYSAFAVGNSAFLLDTWSPLTRPASIRLDPAQQWIDLQILSRVRGGLLDSYGEVIFRAEYVVADVGRSMTEMSKFQRVAGRWMYVAAGSSRER
jgi:SEC-C motif-containing protein